MTDNTTSATNPPDAVHRLDALVVEAALRGRRPFRELPAPEAAEVLRILARRGDRLGRVAALLDVELHLIAEQYAAASGSW
ncbi:hypothetical protein GCM10022243_64090 [Saccharothrix violaceirubra]|uniref:Uncharacterized protein n=1 Tax=Saccharothrix violaceirubra TaxID=413306 RepID=A0A7W7WZQ4_9PSEU|nr:hypothetical protein [Saccharothrix violaceirubra]MBB4969106.1 hypothetical protein [Saccharothrix violaceirubra]